MSKCAQAINYLVYFYYYYYLYKIKNENTIKSVLVGCNYKVQPNKTNKEDEEEDDEKKNQIIK